MCEGFFGFQVPEPFSLFTGLLSLQEINEKSAWRHAFKCFFESQKLIWKMVIVNGSTLMVEVRPSDTDY